MDDETEKHFARLAADPWVKTLVEAVQADIVTEWKISGRADLHQQLMGVDRIRSRLTSIGDDVKIRDRRIQQHDAAGD